MYMLWASTMILLHVDMWIENVVYMVSKVSSFIGQYVTREHISR